MPETLRESLKAAAEAGIIDVAQVEPLAGFVEARAGAPAADEASAEEDSEIPRFIRGYHDVLITIGIVVVLIGLAGLSSLYVVLAAVLVLAEIFVYRQRLALPSFALTAAFALSAAWIIVSVDTHSISGEGAGLWDSALHLSALAAAECVALALFYWRYRVPVALSVLITAAVVTLTALCFSVLYRGYFGGYDNRLVLVCGLVLVAIAMRYDLTDPKRVSTHSDVAFWLYLIAVPAMLKGIFGSIAPETTGGALLVVAVVVAVMLLGLLLDRRAFVTAGLVYLGYAFAKLIGTDARVMGRLEPGDTVMWVLVAIGVIVLGVGFG